jgi:hypothetical protein
MKKLLVAIRPEDYTMLSDALGDEFDMTVCHTLADAKAALGSHINLIICGLHFDDGNMFPLLEHVRANPATSVTPFFCVKGAGGAMSPAIFKSVIIATERMGADGFVDVARLRGQLGDAHTYAVLREELHRILDKNAGQTDNG